MAEKAFLPMSKLKINVNQQSDAIVVGLTGSADMTEVDTLKKQLLKYIQGEHLHVVIDLSELTFISSMGLGSLIQAHQLSQDRRGHLSLANPQTGVAKVLQTTQLDHLFDIYPSVEEAISGQAHS